PTAFPPRRASGLPLQAAPRRVDRLGRPHREHDDLDVAALLGDLASLLERVLVDLVDGAVAPVTVDPPERGEPTLGLDVWDVLGADHDLHDSQGYPRRVRDNGPRA